MNEYTGSLDVMDSLFSTGDTPGASQPGGVTDMSPGTASLVVKEKTPAPDDTNEATRITIQKMCEYIRKAAQSDICKRAAGEALRYAAGQQQIPEMVCWGVFWCAKHRVKFSRDEPRLFRTGDPEALDLLIAPDVLLSQSKPTEDCDGFTMLVCCLLSLLGIKSYIITVAADPEDPERWSHVFAMAQLPNGHLIPLDASHGKQPGWMVPAEHVFRWQAWSLDGKPADVPRPKTNTLHGYVPIPRRRVRRVRRGVGDDSSVDLTYFGGDTGTTVPVSTPAIPAGLDLLPTDLWNEVFGTSPSTTPTTLPSSPGSSPTNWSGIINSLFSGASKVIQQVELPSGYFTNPNTGQLIYAPTNTPVGTGLSFTSTDFTSLLPLLGIGWVAILVISMMGKK